MYISSDRKSYGDDAGNDGTAARYAVLFVSNSP